MVKRQRTEIYSRICGYLRPIKQWNLGKVSEFADRLTFNKILEEKNESKNTKKNC